MKTIELTDEDYETIMGLSKELQLQNNSGQAFPYFWTPSSEKLEVNINDEGLEREFYYEGETYDDNSEGLEDLSLSEESLWEKFCVEENLFIDGEGSEIIKYSKEHEDDWRNYIENYTDADFYSCDWKRISDFNPSLFMSDVKDYCTYNTHHLGRKPAPYSDSIWRMPKMHNLIEVLARINKQPKESVNHEIKRYVYKEDK